MTMAAIKSYNDILNILENLLSSNYPANKLIAILTSHKANLINPTHAYHHSKANLAELNLLKSGKLVHNGEKITLHNDWINFLIDFSALTQLDYNISYGLLEGYLYYLNSSNNSLININITLNKLNYSSINIADVLNYYYLERTNQIAIICSVLRIYLNSNHEYNKVVTEFLLELLQEGLETNLFNALKSRKNADWLSSKFLSLQQSAAKQGIDQFQLCSNLADQIVLEESLLIECLFLLYYESDNDNSTLSNNNEHNSSGRILELLELIYSNKFGRSQPLYPYLSHIGRGRVNDLSKLYLLLGMELLQLDLVQQVFSYPLEELQEELNHLSSAQEKAARKQIAIDTIEAATIDYNNHPLTSRKTLEKIDKELFSNTNIALLQANDFPIDYHSCLSLAWVVFLSLIIDFEEQIQTIRSNYNLATKLKAKDFLAEKQLIIARLSQCFSPSILSPFDCLYGLLNSLNSDFTGNNKVFMTDGKDPNLPAYKQIINELLTALFQSPVYNAILQLPEQHNKLYPLYSSIFLEDSNLSFRFWENDRNNPHNRPLLFDSAIAVFPIQTQPLINLLQALIGETSKPNIDAAYCASCVYSTLSCLHFYTSNNPPTQHLQLIAANNKSMWEYVLLQDWLTEDNVSIAQGTLARVIEYSGNNYYQFAHQYSAWPLLISKLANYSNENAKANNELNPFQVHELQQIQQLCAKLFKADKKLLHTLQGHLNQSNFANLSHINLKLLQYLAAKSSPHFNQKVNILTLNNNMEIADTAMCIANSNNHDATVLFDILSNTLTILLTVAHHQPAPFLNDLLFYFNSNYVSSSNTAAYNLLNCLELLHRNLELKAANYPAMNGLIELASIICDEYEVAKLTTSSSPLALFDYVSIVDWLSNNVLLSYNQWTYKKRLDRWVTGQKLLRLFCDILTRPSNAAALHLFHLFVGDLSMFHALVDPVLSGRSFFSSLFQARKSLETVALQEFLLLTLQTIQHIIAMEKLQGKSNRQSFQQSLLELYKSKSSANNLNQSDQLHSASFLLSLIDFCTESRYLPLQLAAIQTLNLLITPHNYEAESCTVQVSSYLSSAAVRLAVGCNELLHAHSTHPQLRAELLLLVQNCFQYQPALSEKLLVNSSISTVEKCLEAGLLHCLYENYLSKVSSLFSTKPAELQRVYSIFYNIWSNNHSAINQQIIAIIRQKPQFWHFIIYPLKQSFGNIQLNDSTASAIYVNQLLVCSWSTQLLSMEILTSSLSIHAEFHAALTDLANNQCFTRTLQTNTKANFDPTWSKQLNQLLAQHQLSNQLHTFIQPLTRNQLNNFAPLTNSHTSPHDYLLNTSFLTTVLDAQSPATAQLLHLCTSINANSYVLDAETIVQNSFLVLFRLLLVRYPIGLGLSNASAAAANYIFAVIPQLNDPTAPLNSVSHYSVLLYALFSHYLEPPVDLANGHNPVNSANLSNSLLTYHNLKRAAAPLQQLNIVYDYAVQIFNNLIKAHHRILAIHSQAARTVHHTSDEKNCIRLDYSDEFFSNDCGLSVVNNLSSCVILIVKWLSQLTTFKILIKQRQENSGSISRPDSVAASKSVLSDCSVETSSTALMLLDKVNSTEEFCLSLKLLLASLIDSLTEHNSYLLQPSLYCNSDNNNNNALSTALTLIPLLLQSLSSIESYNIMAQNHDYLIQALKRLQPILPALLNFFSTAVNHTINTRLFNLFAVLSGFPLSAAALYSAHIITHLVNYKLFNPNNLTDAYANNWPSFSPYASGVRDQCHSQYCVLFSILTNLLLNFPHSKDQDFLNSLNEFYCVYRARMYHTIESALSGEAAITLGSLEELEAITHFLQAFYTAHQNNPYKTVICQAILRSASQVMRLLNDARLLQSKAKAVSKTERSYLSNKNLQSSESSENNFSVNAEESKEANISSDQVAAENKATPAKKQWNLLGESTSKMSRTASSGLTNQLIHAESKSNSAALPSATPSLISASSFFLPSRSNNNSAATNSIFDINSTAPTAPPFSSPPAAAAAAAAAYFIQHIEYSLCSILRHCLTLLSSEALQQFNRSQPLSTILFNYRIKVIDLGANFAANTTNNSNNNRAEGAAHSVANLNLFADSPAQEHYAELLDNEENYDYYGIYNKDKLPATAAAALSLHSPALSSLIDFSFYCLRILIKLNEGNKLAQENSSNESVIEMLLAAGSEELEGLESIAESNKLSLPPTLKSLNSIQRLGNTAQQAGIGLNKLFDHLFTAGAEENHLVPESVNRLIAYLFEQSLYLIMEYSNYHSTNLLSLYNHLMQIIQTQLPESSLTPRLLTVRSVNSSIHQSKSRSSSDLIDQLNSAAIRVMKVLENYIDRLTGLYELLQLYLNSADSSNNIYLTTLAANIQSLVMSIVAVLEHRHTSSHQQH
jgi:hypothetical protein